MGSSLPVVRSRAVGGMDARGRASRLVGGYRQASAYAMLRLASRTVGGERSVRDEREEAQRCRGAVATELEAVPARVDRLGGVSALLNVVGTGVSASRAGRRRPGRVGFPRSARRATAVHDHVARSLPEAARGRAGRAALGKLGGCGARRERWALMLSNRPGVPCATSRRIDGSGANAVVSITKTVTRPSNRLTC